MEWSGRYVDNEQDEAKCNVEYFMETIEIEIGLRWD